jgi:arginine decarboxylase
MPRARWIEETVKGDTARDVLGYMQYDVAKLVPRIVRDCEVAVRAGRMNLQESRVLTRFYETALDGYTYLESDR